MAGTRRRGDYRKVWEDYHNTKIPDGYHIHHLDGDGYNDDPENLICVSPNTHFWIHHFQGDRFAGVRGRIKLFNQSGRKPTEATKEKMRLANRGKIRTEVTKEKMRIAATGRKATEATKEKMRLAWTTHRKDRNRIAATGKKRTDATKEKMSQAAKRRWQRYREKSPEVKEDIRIARAKRLRIARAKRRKLKNNK